MGCRGRGKIKEERRLAHTNLSQQLGTPEQNEMPPSLRLYCHKGKGAICPTACVER